MSFISQNDALAQAGVLKSNPGKPTVIAPFGSCCIGVPTLTLLSLALVAQSSDEWPAYGRDAGGNRVSPLAAINRKNVAEQTAVVDYQGR